MRGLIPVAALLPRFPAPIGLDMARASRQIAIIGKLVPGGGPGVAAQDKLDVLDTMYM